MDFSIRVAMETILGELGDDFGAAKNAVMSPASLDIALRMVACGAQGPTPDELLHFLEAKDVEHLNSNASATMSALSLLAPTEDNSPARESNPAAIMSHANAVWVDQNYSLSESFKRTVTDVYQADTNAVDFKSQVLELPYESSSNSQSSSDSEFCMYIYLPREKNGLPEMLRKHFGGSNPGQEISETLGKLKYSLLGKVQIPKWKFSLRCHLKERMQKLGLKLPFECSNDFGEMFSETNQPKIEVSRVIQSAFIEVNEKGTVAAAATAVICRRQLAAAAPRRRIPVDDFVADHPFMFLIMEKQSKAVIFAGSVVDPLQQR
ncbi:Os01g0765400 [Linum grandiflorum]